MARTIVNSAEYNERCDSFCQLAQDNVEAFGYNLFALIGIIMMLFLLDIIHKSLDAPPDIYLIHKSSQGQELVLPKLQLPDLNPTTPKPLQPLPAIKPDPLYIKDPFINDKRRYILK